MGNLILVLLLEPRLNLVFFFQPHHQAQFPSLVCESYWWMTTLIDAEIWIGSEDGGDGGEG